MGWWDAWSTVKEKTKNWGSTILNNASMKKMVKGLGKIAVQDVAPILVVSVVHQMVQQQGKQYLQDNPEEGWISTYTAIEMGLWLLWAAHGIYTIRQGTRATIHAANLAMEVNGFNTINQDSLVAVCNKTKEIGTLVLNNTTVQNTALGAFNFSYNTMGRLLEQIPAVPRVIRTVANPKIWKMAKGLARIAGEDVAPLVVAGFVHELIQKQGSQYLQNHPNEAWISTYTAMQCGLWLLWAAHGAYSFRKKTQAGVRTAILIMEASSGFNSLNQTSPMNLCEEEHCTGLRFLKGSFRETIAYGASLGLLWGISWVPVVGEPLQIAGKICLNGRYVTTLVLPKLCGPHQEQYLREYQELALAYGITHAFLTYYLTNYLEARTGIPSYFYKSSLEQFLLIAQIGLASQMTLPPPVRQSQRIPDPLWAFESFIGFTFDTLIIGLKKQIPRLLKENKAPIIPWSNIPGYAEAVWTNPFSDKVVKRIFVPRMLRSLDAFKDDPVIPWTGLRSRTINAIKNTKEVRSYLLTKLLMLSPSATAELAKPIFGTPKSVVEFLLNLMKDDEFMLKLGAFRNKIGGVYRGNPPPIPNNPDSFLLRDQPEVLAETQVVLPSFEGTTLVDPRSVIIPKSSTKIVEIKEEEEKRVESESTVLNRDTKLKITADMVITKRKGSGENSTPHMGAKSPNGFFNGSNKLDPALVFGKKRETNQQTSSMLH